MKTELLSFSIINTTLAHFISPGLMCQHEEVRLGEVTLFLNLWPEKLKISVLA